MFAAQAYTIQEDVDPANLKINRTLPSLNVMEVSILFQNLGIELPFELLQRHQVNGELLSLIVDPSELTEMGIQIPALKARLLMKKIETFKAEGVPGSMIKHITQPISSSSGNSTVAANQFTPLVEPMAQNFQSAQVQAELGSVSGQLSLAMCYDQGQGVAVDKAKVFHYYKLAADSGHPQAQCNVGVCFHQGIGVSKNKPEAFRYFRLSADQGYEGGMFNLAMCYWKGKGTERDMRQALLYFELSAALGNVNSLTNLGYCYDKGEGVAVDKARAFQYYKQAADQGQPTAQHCVGVFLWSGEGGVMVNRQLAFTYWKSAADFGRLASAQRAVSHCYAKGDGVMKDKREAKRYSDLAAANSVDGGAAVTGCRVS